MPRKPRNPSDTGVYHFINRGVNKKKLFHKEEDYLYYLALLKEHSEALGIKIFHYCLMVNHTHILLCSPDIESLSRFGHFVQRRYAYYCCKVYKWSEQVFKKRFISLPINQDSYLLDCGRYIERNPVRAKLTDSPKDYPYSSYPYYAEGKPNVLISTNPLYLDIGNTQEKRKIAYKEYVNTSRPYEQIIDEALMLS